VLFRSGGEGKIEVSSTKEVEVSTGVIDQNRR
jgi:hypothetical protein